MTHTQETNETINWVFEKWGMTRDALVNLILAAKRQKFEEPYIEGPEEAIQYLTAKSVAHLMGLSITGGETWGIRGACGGYVQANYRTCYLLDVGELRPIPFKDLKKGDRFTLKDFGKDPVELGNVVNLARDDAYQYELDSKGTKSAWTIQCSIVREDQVLDEVKFKGVQR